MVLADLPYQVTKNTWDTEIDLEELWTQYERIIVPNGIVVLFAQNKFSARLIMSNEKMYRYSLVWNKVLPSGFLNANRMPLRSHEDILVFYKKLPTYNPQFSTGKPIHDSSTNQRQNNNYGKFKNKRTVKLDNTQKFPISILNFPKPHPDGSFHPTQKPVPLLEYLIKTYTNENDLVVDNVMGSGSTGVAAVNTGRNFIGMEKDEKYFEIAKKRILLLDKGEIL